MIPVSTFSRPGGIHAAVTAALILLATGAGSPVLAQLPEGLPNRIEMPSSPSPAVYSTLKADAHAGVDNTGAASLDVPLFTLAAEGQSFATSLVYRTSGVRAEEVASPVGLGWHHRTGASLVRVVNGIADEKEYGYANDYEAVDRLALEVSRGDDLSEETQAILERGYDTGPDVFRYTVGGISGEFRLSGAGGVVHYPENNVRVTYSADLETFTLTAPNGMQYAFGGEDETGLDLRSYTGVGGSGPPSVAYEDPTAYTQWHPREIADARGYVYFRFAYVEARHETEVQTFCTEGTSGYTCDGGETDGSAGGGCSLPGGSPSNNLIVDPATSSRAERAYTVELLPSRVENPATGRYMEFEYGGDREDVGRHPEGTDADRLRLSSASLYDGDQSTVKRFVQTYARANTAIEYYERKLILTGINSEDAGGVVFNREEFDYFFDESADGTYATVSRLTPYLDHWGYINDLGTGNVSYDQRGPEASYYVFDITNDAFIAKPGERLGLSKEPDLEGSQHGSLRSYDDGKGLRTEYSYGLHAAAKYAPTDADYGPRVLQATISTCNRNSDIAPFGCEACGSAGDGGPDPDSDFVTLPVDTGRIYFVEWTITRFETGSPANSGCSFDGDEEDLETTIRVVAEYNDPSREGEVIQRTHNNAGPVDPTTINISEEFLGLGEPGLFASISVGISTVHGTAQAKIFTAELEQAEFEQAEFEQAERYGDRVVGGVRLTEVRAQDLILGQESTTAYQYTEDDASTRSSGRLLREPSYGYELTVSNATGGADACRYSEVSARPDNPLFRSGNAHVKYVTIEEVYLGDRVGSTRTTYREPLVSVAGRNTRDRLLDAIGYVYEPGAGDMLQRETLSESGKAVHTEKFSYSPDQYIGAQANPNAWMLPTLALLGCSVPPSGCGAPSGQFVEASARRLQSVRRSVRQVEVIADGVTSFQTYTYSPVGSAYHLLRSEFLANGDRTETSITEYDYLVEVDDVGLAGAAVANNQVSAVSEKTHVRSTTAGRTEVLREKTGFSVIDLTGAIKPAGTENGWLVTADQTTVGSGGEQTIQVSEALAYAANGFPTEVSYYGDAPVTYTLDRDRVRAVDYLQYHTETDYYGTSSRKERTLSADAQETTYEYDLRNRLETTTERDGARVTRHAYGTYSETGGTQQNWTEQTVAITPVETSLVTELKTRTYLNGRRNPIQTIYVNQLDGGGDRIDDLGYDDYGRLTQRFETRMRPSSSTAYFKPVQNMDNLESYRFASDPLDRVIATSVPFWGSTTTAYRSASGDYGIRNAFAVTVTDGEGYAVTEYTDVFGRVVHRASNATEGMSVRTVYDGLGHLDKVYRAWPDQSAANTIEYAQDAFGRTIAKSVPEEGEITYGYDRRGRLVGEQGPRERAGGFARGFIYDEYGDLAAAGQLASVPQDWDTPFAFTLEEWRETRSRSRGTETFGKVELRDDRYTSGSASYSTAFAYDEYGREITTTIRDGLAGSADPAATMRTDYDQLDNTIYHHEAAGGDRVVRRTTINTQGYANADEYTVDSGDGPMRITRDRDYREDVVRKRLNADAAAGPWQAIDYLYYRQGPILTIGGPNAGIFPEEFPLEADGEVEPPLFHQVVLRTYEHRYLGIPGRRDGLVSWTSTRLGRSTPLDVGYTYDSSHDKALAGSRTAFRSGKELSRGVKYRSEDAFATEYAYRPRKGLGALSRIIRQALVADDPVPTLADDLVLSYGDMARPGRVTTVADGATAAGELYDVGPDEGDLVYDATGSATAVPGVDIAYDVSGKSETVTLGSGTTTNANLYGGERVAFTTPAGESFAQYGSMELRDGVPYRFYHEDGYYDFVESRWVFHVRDHLGTPRIWFTDVNGDGVIKADDDILETRTAYPFGMFAFGSKVDGHESDRHDYTGHELVGATNDPTSRFQAVVDMRARTYLPGLGMFSSPDPLADLAPGYSPYRYAFNAPLNFVHPGGLLEAEEDAEHNVNRYSGTRRGSSGSFRSSKTLNQFNDINTSGIERTHNGTIMEYTREDVYRSLLTEPLAPTNSLTPVRSRFNGDKGQVAIKATYSRDETNTASPSETTLINPTRFRLIPRVTRFMNTVWKLVRGEEGDSRERVPAGDLLEE